MKKRLFLGLAALVAVTFTGCQKDQVINQTSENTPIEFGTYVGRGAQTKAHVIDNKALKEEGFGVFAYYTGNSNFDKTNDVPNFMYNQCVSYPTSGTTWSYSPIKYWPNNTGDKLTFFAYAPWDNEGYSDVDKNNAAITLSANTAKGSPVITYSVDFAEVTNHEDLLWAAPAVDQEKQTVGGNIKFDFKHALSRIGFKVQYMIDKENTNNKQDGEVDNGTDNTSDLDANTTIKIESVTLSGNFYAKGDMVYTENAGSWGVNFTNRHAVDSKFTLQSGKHFEDVANNVRNSTPMQLNNEESYLMIIPKSFSGAASDKLTVNVVYTVTTEDARLYGGKSVITNNITTVPFSLANGFEAGKAYNLNLHIGLTSVKLTAEVAQWEESDNQDFVVNVPINTK